MAPRETSRFRCDRCGTTEPATGIEYDGLGYPVCPTCGARDRPVEATLAREDGRQRVLSVESDDAQPDEAGQFNWVSPQ